MDRDLRLRVIFAALDRLTAPLRGMTGGARSLSRGLSATRAELRGLERQQAQLAAHRGLSRSLADTYGKLDQARRKMRELRTEIAGTENPTKRLTNALKAAEREEARLSGRVGEQSQKLNRLQSEMRQAGADVANLGRHEERLGQQVDQATRRLRTQEQQLARVDRLRQRGAAIGAAGGRMRGAGAMMTGLVSAPLIALAVASAHAQTESRDAWAQVEAAQLSMHGASGRTMAQLQAQSRVLMHGSTRDDDDIMRSVTANLLTFSRVSGPIFDRAQQSILDVSARLRMELQPATLLVGKALNDPVRGLTAMRRAGIQFTDQQQRQIRAMVAHNNMAGAQAMMLAELERQFRGSALAQRQAAPGRDVVDEWRDMQETLGAIVLNDLPPLIHALHEVLQAFNQLSPGTQQTIVKFMAVAIVLGPVITLLGGLVSGIGMASSAIAGLSSVFGVGLLAGGGILLAIVAAVALLAYGAYQLYQNWEPVSAWFSSTWSSIWSVIGPPIETFVGQFVGAARAVGRAFTMLWNGPVGAVIRGIGRILLFLGGVAVTVLGGMLVAQARIALAVLGGAFEIIGHLINAVCDLLTGDFSGAWNEVKAIFSSAVSTIASVLGVLFGPFQAVLTRIGNFAVGAWNGIKATFSGAVAFFASLPGRFYEFGANMIRSLGRGLLAPLRWLRDTVVGVADRVRNWFSSHLGIHSPSRVFMELGGFVTQGLALGLDRGGQAPVDRIAGIARRMSTALAIGAAAAPAMAAGGPGAGGSASGPGGGNTYIINIHQQPGQSAQDLAAAIRTELDRRDRAGAAARLSSYRDDD